MTKQNATTIGTRVFLCGLAFLALWCNHDGGSAPHKVDPVPCSTVNSCVYADAGRCVDKSAPKCVLVDAGSDAGECLYGYKANAGCVCPEGSSRICTLDAGVFGVQMCDPLSGASGTEWGYCQPLNP